MPPGRSTTADSILTIRTQASDNWWSMEWATLGPREAQYPHYPAARAFQYGYFEARMRFTNHRRARPAFWLLNHERTNLWPAASDCSTLNAEWDIAEPGVGNFHPDTKSYMVLHENTGGQCGVPDAAGTMGVTRPEGGLSDWHVWSGLWAPDSVTSYLDDQQIGDPLLTYDSTHQPMHIIFNIRPEPNDDTPLPPALELEVDWVRAWQKP